MSECENDLLWRLQHPLLVHDNNGRVEFEKDATEADLCNAALEIARITAERDTARAALKRLCNEVEGAWSIGQPGIRQAIGNTNYACVAQGLEDARAALASTETVASVPNLDALRCPTDEMLNAWLKLTGEWVEPYEAERESGVEIECSITPEWADELNADQREVLRRGWVAAVSALTSTETVAGDKP
jgi:hypothetical protein